MMNSIPADTPLARLSSEAEQIEFADRIRSEALSLRHMCSILYQQLDWQLNPRRGTVEGTSVKLQFQQGTLDQLDWLAGEILDQAISVSKSLDAHPFVSDE